MIRIAVDAMGGDHAPAEIVLGAVQAARAMPQIDTLYLVGDETAIRRELDRTPNLPASIQVFHASEVIGMEESPATAVRRKKDSSINRAVELVKEGKASAVFSAGNTGAAVAATTLKLRLLEGVVRPGIAAVFPSPVKPFVLLDVGATPDCTPEMLAQFGVMGRIYAREILGIENPTTGLLSIGEEDAKGNDVTKEAFRLLEANDPAFQGNVESRDLFNGKVDVGICDGFVGNVVLKTSESVAKVIGKWVKDELTSNLFYKLGALMLRGAFRRIKERSDPAVYGGAQLLGVNGLCIIGHGSSTSLAARNGIRVAAEGIQHQINPHIVDEIKQIKNGAGQGE